MAKSPTEKANLLDLVFFVVTYVLFVALVLRFAGSVHRFLRPVKLKRDEPLPKVVFQPAQRLHRLTRVFVARVPLTVVAHFVERRVVEHAQRRTVQLFVLYPPPQQVLWAIVRRVGFYVPQLPKRAP